MKDIPIIFSAPMVRALLRETAEIGTGKTMTRRLAWGNKCPRCSGRGNVLNRSKHPTHPTACPRCRGTSFAASPWQRVKAGDRLWVKETHWRFGRWRKAGKTKTGRQRWRFKIEGTTAHPHFLLGKDVTPPKKRTDLGWHKRPSIFMPRWVSRLTLVITATKNERLQEISEQDCEREGLVWVPSQKIWGVEVDGGYSPYGLTASECFMNLFCDLHGPSIWRDNPEVVALTFAVHKRNIDAMPKEIAA